MNKHKSIKTTLTIKLSNLHRYKNVQKTIEEEFNSYKNVYKNVQKTIEEEFNFALKDN